MKQLWSPWRMDYVAGDKEIDGCPFCRLPQEADDRDNLILYRGRQCFVILNRYPYINGHLMIVPYAHADSLSALTVETQAEMMAALTMCIEALQEVMRPDGANVGVNLGRAAGAGIVEHLHMHVVPRWVGDTNFMSVFCETRVICEALEETYDRLKPLLEPHRVPWSHAREPGGETAD